MSAAPAWSDIAEAVVAVTGCAHGPVRTHGAAGGCINDAAVLEIGEASWFVKLNRAERLDMFEAERDALHALAAPGAVRVPAPVHVGVCRSHAYLVLEHVRLVRPDAIAGRRLGEGLAALHARTATRFGWHRDNTVGSTPQDNTPEPDWAEFFARRRLAFQLDLLAGRCVPARLVDRARMLVEEVAHLLAGHRPVPSLLHGDLWGGNWAADESGRPVVFDPATYHGDREADLAMTELFGGFPASFRESYESAWPLADGYPVRRDLYNLYHVLNHATLFGAAYERQAETVIDRLLAEVH